MKRWMVMATIGALVTLGVGAAYSSKVKTVHVATTITHEGDVHLIGDRFLLTGQVKARHDYCRDLRGVDVTAELMSGRTKTLDFDATSSSGAWAVKANLARVERLKAKAPRDVIHVLTFRNHHRTERRVICKAAAVVWRVA